MQSYKIGTDILDAVTRLDFNFNHEISVSTLPKELNTLFDTSGKRFRPALVFLFGQVFGLNEQDLAPFAKAVEMTHTASLVHDDVIDEASERRSVPTLNHRFSDTQAILAGDFLLARVIGDLLKTGKVEVIQDLTDAIKDLADGEWLQAKLKSEGAATWEELEMVAKKKTGSLMLWSCTTPAKLASQSSEIVSICRDLGNDIGIYFQMLDDVNDFNPQSGKPFAADIMNGQMNFVTVKMLEINPSLKQNFEHFRKTGEFTCIKELELAKQYVVDRSIDLESDLNQRYHRLAEISAPHTLTVFSKMLTKVRQAFAKG
ncbi:MAG: polyprenyl synthetase family protein [Bacteriovoracaceae bacterium]|nr:polyprenyl synthetase family protein [Bacteriovoracaceae bacterium]